MMSKFTSFFFELFESLILDLSLIVSQEFDFDRNWVDVNCGITLKKSMGTKMTP